MLHARRGKGGAGRGGLQNESAVRELTDETLKKIAHELAENLRRNLTVEPARVTRRSFKPAAPGADASPSRLKRLLEHLLNSHELDDAARVITEVGGLWKVGFHRPCGGGHMARTQLEAGVPAVVDDMHAVQGGRGGVGGYRCNGQRARRRGAGRQHSGQQAACGRGAGAANEASHGGA